MLLLWIAGVALGAEPPLEATWDLTDLFESVEDWEGAYREAEAEIAGLSSCAGALRTSSGLLGCLERRSETVQLINRVNTYAGCASAVDVSNPEALARQQRASLLWSKLGEVTSGFDPELLALGEKKVTKLIDKSEGLEAYRYPLRKVLRQAEHTLDPAGEELLARSRNVSRQPYEIYNILSSAELPRPTLTLSDGTEIRVDSAAYGRYRSSQVRADREAVMKTYLGVFSDYEETVGASLNAAIGGIKFHADARKYGSTLEAALAYDALPEGVYRALVEQVHEALPTLHRYLELRKRMLGVDELHYHDLYPPLVEGSKATYDLARGKELTLTAMAPLGDDYVDRFRDALDDRWMDVYPREGKQGGGWMDGSVYDVHPYILLNYNDDFEGVSVLAHEWGHAVHTLYANESQPSHLADYATFTAEVPSTAHQVLLLETVLEEAKGDDERLAMLGHALENMRGTFFRQTMFAEFELAAHEEVAAGRPLTGAKLSELYLDLLRTYHGHDEGVMVIDEAYAIEWAIVPHFYWDFYVFQYATSLTAAQALMDPVLAGEEGAAERFIDLLRAGGSDDPYILLRRAGVDMARPEPYRAMATEMNRVMDEIEAILDGTRDLNASFLDPELDVDEWVGRFESESREVFKLRHEITAAMELEPGQAVADVGAGTGLYVSLFADAVGDAGRVFAVDISPVFVDHLRSRAELAGLGQVEAVLGTETSVELPTESIDAAFVCDTYHHFSSPKESLESIRTALKPGGRMYVLDFDRVEGRSSEWVLEHLRAGKEEFIAEIEAEGFALDAEIEIDGLEENYLLRFTLAD